LRLKVYTNIKLQDTTPRIEDSINIHEGNNNHKPTKATREASTLQDLNCELKTSNSCRILFVNTRYSDPTNLKSVSTRARQETSATSTLQPPTAANEDDLHLRQKKVFDATQSIIGGLEEQPLRPNSNLVSAPLTSTLRNLGTRFCLRGEEL
jgi:hypothetical protein